MNIPILTTIYGLVSAVSWGLSDFFSAKAAKLDYGGVCIVYKSVGLF